MFTIESILCRMARWRHIHADGILISEVLEVYLVTCQAATYGGHS